MKSAHWFSAPSRWRAFTPTFCVRNMAAKKLSKFWPTSDLDVSFDVQTSETALSVRLSKTGWAGMPEGKSNVLRLIGSARASSKRTMTAANWRITITNSSALTWTQSGCDGLARTPRRMRGLHRMSNQKHIFSQKAPPASKLASPRETTCGSRGMTQATDSAHSLAGSAKKWQTVLIAAWT